MGRIPANVARGAALLDDRMPGWRDEIDTVRLNLGNSCDCVLGELLGDYDRGLKLLGLDHRGAVRHGFFKQGRQTWDRLTAGWRRAVGR